MREEGEKAQEPQSLHNHEQESKWLVVPPFCLKEKQGRERSRASVGSEARCLDRKRTLRFGFTGSFTLASVFMGS